MDQICIAQDYVNLMAEAFQMLAPQDVKFVLLWSTPQFNEIMEYIRTQICQAHDATELLRTIRELLDEMRKQPERHLVIAYAKAISLCMDQRITYAEPHFQTYENGWMHLYDLVPTWSDKKPVVITSLNTNREETRICIAPKFPVTSAISSWNNKRESLSSRNALFGINGELSNVIYYLYGAGYPEVRHVILPERIDLEGSQLIPEWTRIAFSPLSDRADLIRPDSTKTLYLDNMPYQAVDIGVITDTAYVENRFSQAWLCACKRNTDIFFAPEMLATAQMVQVENGGSVFLKPLIKQALLEDGKPPRLTIMPSYWNNGCNQVFVFDETGEYLGAQLKRFPYFNRKSGMVEAIGCHPLESVFVFHMKNQHRVALCICAEFLPPQGRKFVNEFLCEQLGVTLVLVPSFSPGETDFIKNLSALLPYGTSVVWGNCCGAVQSDAERTMRIIGACSYAGIDGISRFGLANKCGFRCGDCTTCMFVLDIPTTVLQEKPCSPMTPTISHIYG